MDKSPIICPSTVRAHSSALCKRIQNGKQWSSADRLQHGHKAGLAGRTLSGPKELLMIDLMGPNDRQSSEAAPSPLTPQGRPEGFVYIK